MGKANAVEARIGELADEAVAYTREIIDLQQLRGDKGKVAEWLALADLMLGLRSAEVGGQRR